MALHQYDSIEQGSEEWLALRLGMVTASTVGQLLEVVTLGADEFDCPRCDAQATDPCVSIAKGKAGSPIQTMHRERTEAAASAGVTRVRPTRNDYSKRLTLLLVSERITGETDYREQYVSNDMLAGQLDEPVAREVYSGHYAHAAETGFMVRDDWGFSLGYSPDGLVGDHGLIEIKCPRAKTHVRTVLADEVPGHYMAQCQAGLLVSGREWIDFVSYVGGMPLFVKRVTPDPEWFAAITAACIQFELDVAQIVADYEARVADMPKTERPNFEIKVA